MYVYIVTYWLTSRSHHAWRVNNRFSSFNHWKKNIIEQLSRQRDKNNVIMRKKNRAMRSDYAVIQEIVKIASIQEIVKKQLYREPAKLVSRDNADRSIQISRQLVRDETTAWEIVIAKKREKERETDERGTRTTDFPCTTWHAQSTTGSAKWALEKGRWLYREVDVQGKGLEYDSPAISRCNNRLVRARNTWDRRERKRENLRYCFIQDDERISSKEAFLLVFFFLFIAVRYLRRDISCLISGITIRNKRKIATSGILWYIRISNRVARSFTSLISFRRAISRILRTQALRNQ